MIALQFFLQQCGPVAKFWSIISKSILRQFHETFLKKYLTHTPTLPFLPISLHSAVWNVGVVAKEPYWMAEEEAERSLDPCGLHGIELPNWLCGLLTSDFSMRVRQSSSFYFTSTTVTVGLLLAAVLNPYWYTWEMLLTGTSVIICTKYLHWINFLR